MTSSKLIFRPRPGQPGPCYPTRRDFLRPLGAAVAGGVLASLPGCDGERAVPGTKAHIKDGMGKARGASAPRDLGADHRADAVAQDLLPAGQVDQIAEGVSDANHPDGGGPPWDKGIKPEWTGGIPR